MPNFSTLILSLFILLLSILVLVSSYVHPLLSRTYRAAVVSITEGASRGTVVPPALEALGALVVRVAVSLVHEARAVGGATVVAAYARLS